MNSIIVPDSLPEILKKYVKAAIRSQPKDIVSWSAEYFKSTDNQYISSGAENSINTKQKQDRTLFRILAFQLGTTIGTKERIEEVWSDLSLDFNLLEQIYMIGNFRAEHVDMVEFLGITFGHWTKSLKETMLLCCEAFCKCLAADGYFMHVDVACKLYGYLAKLDCSLPGDDYTGGGKPAVVQTSKSLDVSPAPPTEGDNLKQSDVSVSLESILSRRLAATAARGKPNTGYHVLGIGPTASDDQVQKVFVYFRKCAADNGGYVYDFDIENDRCPQLDAINNN
ncbi:ropporin-1-like [Rhopalosiphum padi]|uniref:ropporin-1-like n=1 Tax=Rhopalosiphum padi TaxID=40932 RepID=UPI00298DECB3|nr:ropporin-1-like [Rhopalosiphum padi]